MTNQIRYLKIMKNKILHDYLNCFSDISGVDYSKQGSVRLRNKQISKARSIAGEIDSCPEEIKDGFAKLLSSDILDEIKLFTAHFMLEVMDFSDVYRKEALRVIKNHTYDLGEQMWLEQYIKTHPDDYGLIN